MTRKKDFFEWNYHPKFKLDFTEELEIVDLVELIESKPIVGKGEYIFQIFTIYKFKSLKEGLLKRAKNDFSWDPKTISFFTLRKISDCFCTNP